jgi:hypothetical protein
MGPDGAGAYRYHASTDDEIVSRAGRLLLDWVGPGIPVPVPAMHNLIQAAVLIANTVTTVPDRVGAHEWTPPLLTTSKAAPGTDFSWSRSSSFQPGSVAPDRNQFDPLSATIIP